MANSILLYHPNLMFRLIRISWITTAAVDRFASKKLSANPYHNSQCRPRRYKGQKYSELAYRFSSPKQLKFDPILLSRLNAGTRGPDWIWRNRPYLYGNYEVSLLPWAPFLSCVWLNRKREWQARCQLWSVCCHHYWNLNSKAACRFLENRLS